MPCATPAAVRELDDWMQGELQAHQARSILGPRNSIAFQKAQLIPSCIRIVL
jgi:hypothetical protein